MIASNLAPGGKLVTFEQRQQMASLASANLSSEISQGKLEIKSGDGLAWLEEYKGMPFDLIFLDCDKQSIAGRENLLVANLECRGYLIIDNSLARGAAMSPQREWEQLTDSINRKLCADDRLLVANFPIRDGLLVCRKIES